MTAPQNASPLFSIDASKVEVQAAEQELTGDTRDCVWDEEQSFEVVPRQMKGDLSPNFDGETFFLWGERREQLGCLSMLVNDPHGHGTDLLNPHRALME